MKRTAFLATVAAVAAIAPWPSRLRAQGNEATETKIVVDGSTTVGPIAKAFAEYYMSKYPEVNITVSESGSGNGAGSLISGVCDVADMSRFMTKDEFAKAIREGVTPVAHVVAIDGLPVIVHPSNPVHDLTIEQIRDIYAGRITSWRDVGGPDKRIVKISRDTNSGTYATFEELIMGEEKIAPDAEYVGSNGAVRQRVQSTPAAIGYAGLGFVDRTVRALSVNGIEPTPASITSGRYPIARPLYMFTNGYPQLGTHLHAFVTLYLAPEGQQIVESIGYVPVTHYPRASAKRDAP